MSRDTAAFNEFFSTDPLWHKFGGDGRRHQMVRDMWNSVAKAIPLSNSIVPVTALEGGHWVVKAAGPTTSAREEPYQGPLMEQYGIRAVIGKGGMGPKTLEYCQKVGGVYLHAIGGAAQVLAERVVAVKGVHLAEKFGSPEAIWEFQVDRFPAVVTMDSHGNSLHAQVLAESSAKLKHLIG